MLAAYRRQVPAARTDAARAAKARPGYRPHHAPVATSIPEALVQIIALQEKSTRYMRTATTTSFA